MKRVLNKRIFRELKQNFVRYAALFLLIVLGMYIVTSMVASSENVIQGTAEKNEINCVEDGEFTVFVALTDEQIDDIQSKGVEIEEMFHFDYSYDNKVIRVMKVREKINRIMLRDGRFPSLNNELVIEQRYADENNISIGDEMTVDDKIFKVCGIGCVPDYDMPIKEFSDTAVESSNFGIVFVTSDAYETFIKKETQKAQEYTYSYRIKGDYSADDLKAVIKNMTFDYHDVEDKYFQNYINISPKEEEFLGGIQELSNGSKRLEEEMSQIMEYNTNIGDDISTVYERIKGLTQGINEIQLKTNNILTENLEEKIENLIMFLEADDNPRINAASNERLVNRNMGLFAGVIVMILFMYVISVFIVHQIQSESYVIGTLYALGVKKKDLILHYLRLPVVIALLGGGIGATAGFSKLAIDLQLSQVYTYYSVPKFENVYPEYLLVYCIVMPVSIAFIVNFIVINKKLSKTALSLMRNERKNNIISNIRFEKVGFIRSFQIKQLLREFRIVFTVVFGMFISMLVFMIGMDSITLCLNVKNETQADTKYNYMYYMKYPKKKLPTKGEAVYTETLSKEHRGYSLDINIFGIDDDNKYFDAHPAKVKNKIAVSKSVQQKYSLSVGDKFILSDDTNDMDYVFTVDSIADYSAGLAVFMDIDSMRQLFNKESDYYNTIFSDEKLDIEEGRVYSITTKEDVIRSSEIFLSMMRTTQIMLLSVSILIFFIVVYLMLKVMIDRSSMGISLIKIFGYRIKEVKKLYLNAYTLVIAICVNICIPLTKIIADIIYPNIISNTACGVNIAFPIYVYPCLFVGVMLIYFIVVTLLLNKLKVISPMEILKNRE